MKNGNARSLPMVSSGMLLPFVAEFERREGDLNAVFAKTGQHRILLDQPSVAAQFAYDLLNYMAAALNDPAFGFKIGTETPFPQLPNLRILKSERASLGELLTALVVDSKNLTTLANYSLTADQDQATLAQHRNFRPARVPVQPDGFFAGFILRIIRETIGTSWNPALVFIRVSSAKAIPTHQLPVKSVTSRSRSDIWIRFPANWLLVRQGGEYVQRRSATTIRVPNLVDSVRELLKLRISDPRIRTEDIAGSLMISKRVLQMELAKVGRSVREELADIRKAHASHLLTSSEVPIAEVGQEVGYPDPASFSRAFRSWSGVSPTKYRSHSGKSAGPDN